MLEGICGRSLLNQENIATRICFLSQKLQELLGLKQEMDVCRVFLEGQEQNKIVPFKLHSATFWLELEYMK